MAGSAADVAMRRYLKAHHHQLIELLEKWDDDGDGHISSKEFRRGVRVVLLDADLRRYTMAAAADAPDKLRQWMAKKLMRVRDVFQSVDGDGSGTIDRSEFRRAMRERLGCVAPRAAIDHLFRSFDEDGSGLVDYREMHDVLVRSQQGSQQRMSTGNKNHGAGTTGDRQDDEVDLTVSNALLDELYDDLDVDDTGNILLDDLAIALRHIPIPSLEGRSEDDDDDDDEGAAVSGRLPLLGQSTSTTTPRPSPRGGAAVVLSPRTSDARAGTRTRTPAPPGASSSALPSISMGVAARLSMVAPRLRPHANTPEARMVALRARREEESLRLRARLSPRFQGAVPGRAPTHTHTLHTMTAHFSSPLFV